MSDGVGRRADGVEPCQAVPGRPASVVRSVSVARSARFDRVKWRTMRFCIVPPIIDRDKIKLNIRRFTASYKTASRRPTPSRPASRRLRHVFSVGGRSVGRSDRVSLDRVRTAQKKNRHGVNRTDSIKWVFNCYALTVLFCCCPSGEIVRVRDVADGIEPFFDNLRTRDAFFVSCLTSGSRCRFCVGERLALDRAVFGIR